MQGSFFPPTSLIHWSGSYRFGEKHSIFTKAMHQELQSVPSPHIDAAICDLVAKISNFSDDYFDVSWMHLTEAEIEALAIALIQHWTEQLEGKLLGGLLLAIRAKAHIPD